MQYICKIIINSAKQYELSGNRFRLPQSLKICIGKQNQNFNICSG